MLRATAAGILDTTFSSDGKFDTYYESNVNNSGTALAIQSDGRILVAGTGGTTAADRKPNDFGVFRLTAAGGLDANLVGTTPGSNFGTVMLGFEPLIGGASNDYLSAIALQNGNIVLYGEANYVGAAIGRLVGDRIFSTKFE